MERERKQEYIGRLTLELLAYDSEATGKGKRRLLKGYSKMYQKSARNG